MMLQTVKDDFLDDAKYERTVLTDRNGVVDFEAAEHLVDVSSVEKPVSSHHDLKRLWLHKTQRRFHILDTCYITARRSEASKCYCTTGNLSESLQSPPPSEVTHVKSYLLYMKIIALFADSCLVTTAAETLLPKYLKTPKSQHVWYALNQIRRL